MRMTRNVRGSGGSDVDRARHQLHPFYSSMAAPEAREYLAGKGGGPAGR